MIYKVKSENYGGKISIPSSKSDSQRAILAAGLCTEISTIYNVGNSADEKVMLNAIQQLGAEVTSNQDNSISIKGVNNINNKIEISCGESGLSSRLLISVASIFDKQIKLSASGSLLNRSMKLIFDILPKLNVEINSDEDFLPAIIKGPINSGEITIDGSMSSQFLSGLLMALPLVKGNSIIHVENLTSTPYIEMTINTLSKFGISIENQDFKKFLIKGNQVYKKTDYTIESDWSSSSYWLVASALGKEIEIFGLSKESLQADKAILNAFEYANCEIIWSSNSLKIGGKQRKAFEFDATNCPDLFPALASFAALTNGISKIKGVHRLKHKESDRGQSIQEEFQKLGIKVKFEEDLMLIYGKSSIEGGKVFAHHDHRIAMCLAVLGMFSKSEIEIENAESVSKSYPNFWEDLESLEL